MIDEIKKRIGLKLKEQVDFEVSALSIEGTHIYLVTFSHQGDAFNFLPDSIEIKTSPDRSNRYFYLMWSQIWNL
ncbi:hypothetical protein [Pedobacter suwonensis]|uniref:hypothetical protein n=1 Tax=Pedobacter suwonensis TaxID=332999 RepID=UPI00367BD57C